MGGPTTVPIEYFVWANQSPNNDRLVYFDEQGQIIEHTVKTGVIELALKAFNGETKAVRRSTGGLVAVKPFQVVLIKHEEAERPSVRVRVRFHDLRFTQKRGLWVPQLMSHTKLVAPEQLQEAFTYSLNQAQDFVLDFGHGVVPIHVFHYDTDLDGNSTAFFINVGDLTQAVHAAPGEYVPIQPYSVPREALRWAGGEATPDKEIARENYARMIRVGAEVIPASLRAGDIVEVPAGNTADVRDYLQLTISQRRSEGGLFKPEWEPILPTESESTLVPYADLVAK